MQSTVPSQRWEERMHAPLLHRNAPLWQETINCNKKFLSTHTDMLVIVKTYGSFSHHFHQSIPQSSHCIERKRRHTGHCYIETEWSCNLGTVCVWQDCWNEVWKEPPECMWTGLQLSCTVSSGCYFLFPVKHIILCSHWFNETAWSCNVQQYVVQNGASRHTCKYSV